MKHRLATSLLALLVTLPTPVRGLELGDTVLLKIDDGTACLGTINSIQNGEAAFTPDEKNATDTYCQIISEEPWNIDVFEAAIREKSATVPAGDKTTRAIFLKDRVVYDVDEDHQCKGTVEDIVNDFLFVIYDNNPTLKCKTLARNTIRYQHMRDFDLLNPEGG